MNTKTHKQIFVIFALTIFIVPQITFAAWWNPVSWFKKNIDETSKVETTIMETPTNTVTPTSATTQESVAPKVIHDTKIIEKPVIQTITVQDPVLQKQINDLLADNAILKSKIEELTKMIESRDNEIQLLKSVPVFSKAEECKNAQAIVDAFPGKYNEVTAREKIAVDDIIAKAGSSGGAITSTDVNAVKNKYKAEKSALAKEMSLAKTKAELYCE